MVVAGAAVEAHARAVAASVVPRATKGIPGRTMDMLTQELMFVLEGSDGAAERCAAMESLFWLQVSQLPCAFTDQPLKSVQLSIACRDYGFAPFL